MFASSAAMQSLSSPYGPVSGSGGGVLPRRNYNPRRAWRGAAGEGKGREARGLLGVVVPAGPSQGRLSKHLFGFVGGSDDSAPHRSPRAAAVLAARPGTGGGGRGETER